VADFPPPRSRICYFLPSVILFTLLMKAAPSTSSTLFWPRLFQKLDPSIASLFAPLVAFFFLILARQSSLDPVIFFPPFGAPAIAIFLPVHLPFLYGTPFPCASPAAPPSHLMQCLLQRLPRPASVRRFGSSSPFDASLWLVATRRAIHT